MNFRKNDIIDYYDNRTISCGLVLDVDERRLRILNDQGKETRISVSRALIRGNDHQFPITGSRDEQIARLRQISRIREELKTSVDLRELWEVVAMETREIDVEDLSELFFGKDNDHDHSASLLRAIFEDRIYFKIRPDSVEVPTAETVEQALIQRQKQRERATFMARSAEFLGTLHGPGKVGLQSAPEGLCSLIEEAALKGPDCPEFRAVKDLFAQAGLPSHLSPLTALVKLGVWDEDENIALRVENISVDFTEEAESLAVEASKKRLPPSLEDLSAEKSITIDSLTTRDLDDAISLTRSGEDYVVGIHIADAAHFVAHDSPLDREIRQRAVSIYLPEMTIPMIPPVLSEQAASLQAGTVRPAVSVLTTFGSNLFLKDFRITQSVIRVHERLSYEEADERIRNRKSIEATLFAIALARRNHRVASGAVIFKDPEIYVSVNKDKTVEVSFRDRESPSQILVSELMILANGLFAKFLRERDFPAIFRSQPPPLEKIELGEEYDPVLSYRGKKNLARGDFGISPAAHATLGLDAYTTVTSPLRRYSDLVVQRQIKSGLNLNTPPLSREEMEKILTEISYRLERAGIMERERQRYFLLKYLVQHKNEEFEAVVLHRFPRFYLVNLTRLGTNAALIFPQGLTLNPHDRAMVRIDKINPREDKLSLSLVKLL